LASAIRDPSVKLFALRVANDLDWVADTLDGTAIGVI
jgi:hypothetical protein